MTNGNHLFFSTFLSIVETYLWAKSFIPASGNGIKNLWWFPQAEKIAVNKRILFPLDKNTDSTSRNEGFFYKKYVLTTRKNCFHRQEYLQITRGKWFPMVGYSIKNGFTSVWIMIPTRKIFALNKRALDRKSVFTRRNEAFDKKSISTSRKN